MHKTPNQNGRCQNISAYVSQDIGNIRQPVFRAFLFARNYRFKIIFKSVNVEKHFRISYTINGKRNKVALFNSLSEKAWFNAFIPYVFATSLNFHFVNCVK